jgi:hypothetical protein
VLRLNRRIDNSLSLWYYIVTIKKEEKTMALINMKNEVITKYGEDSFEAGYISYVFAKRSTEYFLNVYRDLMGK